MNTSHYPSLELCKRLTWNGFPKTEKGEYFPNIDTYLEKPSIAELLDSLREDRRRVAHREYSELKDSASFPDYLAEFYLFEKENKYLP